MDAFFSDLGLEQDLPWYECNDPRNVSFGSDHTELPSEQALEASDSIYSVREWEVADNVFSTKTTDHSIANLLHDGQPSTDHRSGPRVYEQTPIQNRSNFFDPKQQAESSKYNDDSHRLEEIVLL